MTLHVSETLLVGKLILVTKGVQETNHRLSYIFVARKQDSKKNAIKPLPSTSFKQTKRRKEKNPLRLHGIKQ